MCDGKSYRAQLRAAAKAKRRNDNCMILASIEFE
jgi:hypothetical protein